MNTKLHSLALAALLFAGLPLAPASAEVNLSIAVAPPPLPVVVQPPCPVEGYLWTPGYWAYDTNYYLVPGAWVPPPEVGLLWTPPWWGFANGVYVLHEGYWGPTVGFYGGINYGFGYFGAGFVGGAWAGDVFRYNTAVVRVDRTVVHNTFVDRTVLTKEATGSRASFNGVGGVKAEATAEQKAAENAQHVSATSEQLSRREAASKNNELRASVNGGHPNAAAIKSLDQGTQQGKLSSGKSASAAAAGAGAGTGSGKAGKKSGSTGRKHTQAHTGKAMPFAGEHVNAAGHRRGVMGPGARGQAGPHGKAGQQGKKPGKHE